jgi:succinate dehydrogenase hydrophobic membrane anchor protein
MRKIREGGIRNAEGGMISQILRKPSKRFLLPALERLPVVSFYAKTRGWPFVIAWIHRVAGVLLALYVLVHLYTLSYLVTPTVYDSKMKVFGFFFFTLLEWLLAFPVIFHAFNGGRLILFEIFGARNDRSMLRWVFGLSATYILLQALLIIMGNQSVSLILFWLTIVILSSCLVVPVTSKIWNIDGAISWKLQRISGAYLLIMIPAHFLFMHLQPGVGHEAYVVISRMQNIFIKFVDLTLVIAVLYHAGYGLISISKDYITSRILQSGFSFLVIFVLAVFGWIGIRLTLTL